MFFFFKQKTAYEMLRSLVGSEMCIRDSSMSSSVTARCITDWTESPSCSFSSPIASSPSTCTYRMAACLLYTSDAADEEDSVDLGGRRIIKKKKKQKHKS